MFFSKKLKKFENLKHCFFSRKNGVSEGVYKSLNCGLGSKDNKANVLKNLEFVSKKMECRKESLISLNQIHSDQVVHFRDKNSIKNKLNADAIVCEVKSIGISILTADCAPILFYDPNKKIIGCAHSGWKGAANGIIKNTIKKFNELNSRNDDLIAVVGPCLSEKNYEVKNDYVENFLSRDLKNKFFFNKIDSEKYKFDLRAFINKELISSNIKNIENIEMDTFSNEEFFYSYSTSRIKNEDDYGRCISVILMT